MKNSEVDALTERHYDKLHILVAGRAICPIKGVPEEWPAGHGWVRIEQGSLATCDLCLAALPFVADRQFEDITPEKSLLRMRAAVTTFYRMAIQTGVHAFWEHAGLLSDFVERCQAAHNEGRDFYALRVEPLCIRVEPMCTHL